ncbi:AraC family transcriptional regulator [Halosquirtibacter xylanolyticus]|uniref:AraC family transcriptional regulator n=1 Tax=Halosquirtibacter xylanolyticus TaxID=3374599 RepID=UPI00374813FB|nr:AraC family transcriptional regulator [Prolixibacteraceae bacterium]
MKKVTNDRYHESLNQVVDYIQLHISENIDLKTLAEVAHISEYHFHRIFKAYIGESLGAYLHRIRLESAASKLRITDQSLTEIAEKVGYNNQQALSKAFKKHFGITPSAFRNLESYFDSKRKPRKDRLGLHPEIRYEEDKLLAYIRIISKYGSHKAYDEAWERLGKFVSEHRLFNGQTEAIGLSFDDPNITQNEKCRFYACYSIEAPVEGDGEIGTLTLKGGQFAVFTLRGSYSQLGQMYDDIYYGWLQESEVRLRNRMSYEKYLNDPSEVNKEDILTEIYIPIK